MDDEDTAFRFDVFISYNTADRVAVERIAHALVERGLAVFIDRWELVPGQPWPEVLERRVGDCASAAVLLGPSGIGTWQHREQFLALDRQARDSRFRVIPVLLPGADPALGFLALNTWVDLRAGVDDPHALDLLAAAARGESPTGLLEESQRTTTDICPYRGLEVFREEDASFFFGREAFTQRLLDQVNAHDFVAVVGASGSGKSSTVRAGLVPMLRRGADGRAWDVLTLTPGTEPLAALVRTLDPPEAGGLIAARAEINAAAARLRAREVTLSQLVSDHLARQPGTDRMLLVVDQFEELATLAEDRAEAACFVDLLLDVSARSGVLSVLITLRSDFYTQIVQRRDLNDRLQGAVVHIGPLSQAAAEGERSELEIVVRCPAEAVGLGFEDGLVERIVADVGDEPGNLPLLEYLLSELWRQRVRGLLTHRAYDTLGGVQRAIAERADATYEQLSPGQQQAARRLFLSLVRPGEGREDTRAPAPFPDDEHEMEVVQRFASPGVRLLVADEDALRGRFIQVGHEALIRGWSRLRHWIAQNRDTLRARDRVRERMQHWHEQNRPADLLLPPGLALEEGRSLLSRGADVAIDELRHYVEASIAADVSRRRWRRTIAGAVSLTGILLLSVTAWQWREAEVARERAEQNERVAERNAREAQGERDLVLAQQLNVAAAKVFEENPGETGLAAMLAMDSQRRHNTPEANALLRDVLSLTPADAPLVDFPWVGADIQFSADGRVQVFDNRDFRGVRRDEPAAISSIALLDREDLSPRSTRRFDGEMRPLPSPNGRWLVNAGLGRRLVITDLDAGIPVVDEATRSATFPVFAPDGNTLYVAKRTGDIEVRDAPDWAVTRQLAFPVAGARNVSLQVWISAEGDHLFVVDRRRGAYLVPTDGSGVKSLGIEVDALRPWFASEHLSSGRVSPVQPLALTQQANGTTRLWDMETGRERLRFEDEARAAAVAFGPDGKTLATANSNGTVFVRDATDGVVRHRWQHREDWNRDDDWINGLTFSADGRLLASAGEDGVVVVRHAEDGRPSHRFELDAPVVALTADPADGTLLAGTEDGILARLDLNEGIIAARQRFDGTVTHVETIGRGHGIAVGIRATGRRSSWHDISFVEHEGGRELSHFSYNGVLRSKRISPDGRWFAAFDPSGDRVLIWDTAAGEAAREIRGHASPVSFSPDSARLLLHDDVGPLSVVDATTREPLFALGEPGGIHEVFGKAYDDRVITNGVDRSLRGWDLAGGQRRWHTIPEQRDRWITTSSNGRRFAYYSKADRAIQVFDSETGGRIGSIDAVRPSGGFSLSDDGSRLLIQHRSSGAGDPVNEIELWDVPAAMRIQRRRIDSQHVFRHPVDGAVFALSGRSIGEDRATSWMELIDWKTGRVAWALSVPHAAPFSIKAVNRDEDWILVEGPSSPQEPQTRQLRSLRTGVLIWEEPGGSLRAAAVVPGSDLIAFADATSPGRNGGVIRLLSRRTGEERRRIDAGGFTRHVAATADGSRVVAAVEGDRWRGVRVWRVDDGRLLREIELDANPRAVLPLSDPDRVAVDDFANRLRVFDLKTGETLWQIAHTRSADTVEAAADADRAVTVAGASMRVWDTRLGREIAHQTSHGDVSSVSISPDGTRIAYLTNRPHTTDAGTEFPAAVIWTPENGSVPVILPVDDANRLEFDPSGRYLALHGNGAYVRLVDTGTRRTERLLRPLRKGKFDRLAFVADSRIVVIRETASYRHGGYTTKRHGLRAFDIASGSELARFDTGFRMLPVPNSSKIQYQDVHGRWRSTDLAGGGLDPVLAVTKSRPDRVATSLAAAPGSPRVLATNYWKHTLVHDLAGGQTRFLASGHEPFNVLHAEMDPVARYVALSTRERDWRDDSPGSIVVFDASDGAELARLETERAMWNIAFAHGGDALVLSELRGHLPREPDQLLLYWNWRTRERKTLASDNPVPYLAVSGDGRRFATAEGSWDTDRDASIGVPRLRVWDGANGTELVRVALDFHPSGVSLSPDGRHVMVGGQNEVLLLDAETGTELAGFRDKDSNRVFTEHDHAIESNSRLVSGHRALGFAARGQAVVIAEANGVLVFDIPQRSTRRLGDGGPVKRMVISADGGLLAMQGERSFSVWDVATGEALIRAELPGVENLTFGGVDGRHLLAARNDRLIRLRWRPEELGSLACRAFGNGDWRRGRQRVIRQAGRHPCDTPTPGG